MTRMVIDLPTRPDGQPLYSRAEIEHAASLAHIRSRPCVAWIARNAVRLIALRGSLT